MLCAQVSCKHKERFATGPPLSWRRSTIFQRIIDFYGRTLDWVLERRHAHAAVWRSATLVLTVGSCTSSFPRGSSRCRIRVKFKPYPRPRKASRSRKCRRCSNSGSRLTILRESGGRKSLLVHRRRRHERHIEQRPDSDQSEAARPAEIAASDVIRELKLVDRGQPCFRHERSTCSRCRTSRSRTS